ncbi:MAG: trypsin-like peptidase domain-containing protein [Clostridia bacterium]|nr:trypsin-like peptidase domain-containing protein [Clostridia bacterium]
MSYFDEQNEKNPENEAPVVPTSADNESPAENEAPVENVAPAENEIPTENEIPAESVADGQSEEPAETQPEAASVSYTPADHYSSHGSTYYANTAPQSEKPLKKKSKAGTVVLCAVLAVVLLVGSFFGGVTISHLLLPNTPGTGEQGGGSQNPPAGGEGGDNQTPTIDRGDVILNVVESVAGLAQTGSVPAVVEAVEMAVVEIRTETAVNDPFNGNYVQSGAGSGVIISADGLVLTCHHVIEGAETITVTLYDGTDYTATVLGTDSWSDLALLDLEGEGFSYATLAKAPEGESVYSYMKVGETAVAIGNPLGELGGSVSVGVISALGREVTVEGMPMTLLQIDASVNPGNSGGGLFNLRGELIGIVNAKSTGDAVEGIGFAIPSTYAIDIVSQLYKQGYVSDRPYLGVYFQSTVYGLQIVSYEFNDELTGGKTLEKGDYLQYIDGVAIEDMSDIRTILADKKPGDTITMTVSRLVGSFGYQSRYESIEVELTVHEYIPSVEP